VQRSAGNIHYLRFNRELHVIDDEGIVVDERSLYHADLWQQMGTRTAGSRIA
jgi:hypothetical protein